MDKMRRLSNKGYSLVEMVITIGIILVVSAMAMVTISTLNSARAKNASVQLDSEITQMVTRAKGQTLKYDELQAIKIYKSDSDSKYYYMTGTATKVSGAYTFTPDTKSLDLNGGLGYKFSSSTMISYTDDSVEPSYKWGVAPSTDLDNDGKILVYNKQGCCINDAGTYVFFKSNGNMVAQVIVRKNGSHVAK